MLICIIGRTGSGKDYLAKKLEEKGLKQIKSYTTRPRRNENEDTHTFITKEEANTITDKIAVTEINGYEYFATYSQVKDNDIYIIDPNGLKVLSENLKDEKMIVVYVKADDNERKNRAINRADNKEKELDIFNKRNESEDAQFTEFENLLDYAGVSKLKRIQDNYEFKIENCSTSILSLWANIYLMQLDTECLFSDYNIDLIDSLYLYRNTYSKDDCDEIVDLLMKEIQ